LKIPRATDERLQVHVARCGERHVRWRGDAHVMAAGHLVRRHEPVEQFILFLRACRP
jgi:hypothetical protein